MLKIYLFSIGVCIAGLILINSINSKAIEKCQTQEVYSTEECIIKLSN